MAKEKRISSLNGAAKYQSEEKIDNNLSANVIDRFSRWVPWMVIIIIIIKNSFVAQQLCPATTCM